MELYHGSNVPVLNPKLIESDRKLDFGSGFYLTSSRDQAGRWANLTTMRRGKGKPTITVFRRDETEVKNLSVLHFKSANES